MDETLPDDPVSVYLSATEVAALAPGEEEKLIRLIVEDGANAEDARVRLTECHLPLVIEVAQEISSARAAPSVHILDLIQIGNEALLRSVCALTATPPGRFAAQARADVAGAIEQHLRSVADR